MKNIRKERTIQDDISDTQKEFMKIAESAKSNCRIEHCKSCEKDARVGSNYCSDQCMYKEMYLSENSESLFLCGVPKLYADVQLIDHTDNQKITALIKSEPRSVFLTGGCGSGKTYAGTTLIKRWCGAYITESGFNTAWITAPDFLSEVKDTFHQSSNTTETKVIEKYASFRLLLLDDLWAENVTEWSTTAIYRLLSKRICNLNPTIVTSNKKLSEISKWNDRIASRLGSFEIVDMGERDRRLER